MLGSCPPDSRVGVGVRDEGLCHERRFVEKGG